MLGDECQKAFEEEDAGNDGLLGETIQFLPSLAAIFLPSRLCLSHAPC